MIGARGVSIALLLCVLASGLEAARKPYHISAARRNDKGKWEEIETAVAVIRGVTFQIRHLGHDDSRRLVSAALGRDIELLGARRDGKPGHLAFVLEIDNDSAEDVIFNPSEAWLQTNKADTKLALDYSGFYTLGRPLGAAAPTTDEIASIFFDRTATIRPGGRVRKLLAFDAPAEDRYERFEVKIVVTIGTSTEEFVFPFRKFYAKR